MVILLTEYCVGIYDSIQEAGVIAVHVYRFHGAKARFFRIYAPKHVIVNAISFSWDILVLYVRVVIYWNFSVKIFY